MQPLSQEEEQIKCDAIKITQNVNAIQHWQQRASIFALNVCV